jgi:protein tyrosine/serine phosphatase
MFHQFRLAVPAALLVGLLATPGGLLAKAPVAANASADLSAVPISNFGRVDAFYYRGAQPDGGDYQVLAKLGVKTVINLTSDDADASEQRLTEQAGLHYVQIPMTTHTPPTAAQIEHFLTIVNDKAQQPVYVHCVGGKHRTGVMTAVYRMTVHGWEGDRAFKEMKQYNYGPDFLHPEFKKFVYGYKPAVMMAVPASPVSVETGPIFAAAK